MIGGGGVEEAQSIPGGFIWALVIILHSTEVLREKGGPKTINWKKKMIKRVEENNCIFVKSIPRWGANQKRKNIHGRGRRFTGKGNRGITKRT